jgi:hypothetical protein
MLRRSVLVLAIVTGIGSSGCLKGLDVTLRVLDATARVAAATAPLWTAPSTSSADPGACCYVRENPTPVALPVDRSMTECEIARGRWREAHQEQDDPPPELQCLADGSYPRMSPARVPPPASASPSETPAEPPAAEPEDMI